MSEAKSRDRWPSQNERTVHPSLKRGGLACGEWWEKRERPEVAKKGHLSQMTRLSNRKKRDGGKDRMGQ